MLWTKWSYVQLAGLFVLLYGTAVYNAPHAGSIKLDGSALACFMKCDYDGLDGDDEEAQVRVSFPTRATIFAVPH